MDGGSINHCALLTSFRACNSNASLTFQNVCGEPESLLIVSTNDIQTTGYRVIRDAAVPVARTEMS